MNEIVWWPLVPGLLIASLATLQPPAWLWMWVIAAAFFAGGKGLTWRAYRDAHPAPPLPRLLGYLLLWPGMDAEAFFALDHAVEKPPRRALFLAMVVAASGAALLWIGVRLIPPGHELLCGWTGMVGLILLLHFGTFQLLALAWQRRGVNAQPIMRRPLAARTLSEFWSSRWNRGFNDLAHRNLFLPLHARIGVPAATLLTFLTSGLIHELVISPPARGGFGLPTGYFLLQGAGVLAQRSRLGKRAGLARGFTGRLVTLAVVAGPIFWLFHPLFVTRVMLPFFAAIGAL